MEKGIPHLYIELNKKSCILVAGYLEENQNFKVKEKTISSWKNPNSDILDNFNELETTIQKDLKIVEKKLNFIFKDITLILDDLKYSCINISGYKKLNGSQLLKENITYILNSLKLSVSENEQKKTILHIFNSKSILDGNILDNLPIGLFGNFYIHELTFILVEDNTLKNIKKAFGKSNLKIKKVFIKNFVEGVQLTKLDNKDENILVLKIRKKNSQIFFFEKGSIRFLEQFNFGTDIIIQDIAKICSLRPETIYKMLSNEIFIEEKYEENDLIDKKNFEGENFRKIRKQLFKEISDARIEEIIKIILHNNINTKIFKKDIKKIFFFVDEKDILKNFKKIFLKHLSQNNKFETQTVNEFDLENTIIETANLSNFGWRKEAIPITHTKTTLISRIFKYIFG
tara:strand:+ start:16472 stop:17671 length:1200 start_codon:yes stop_codon:yes gene_type:complete